MIIQEGLLVSTFVIQMYSDGFHMETDLSELPVIHNKSTIKNPSRFTHHVVEALIIQVLKSEFSKNENDILCITWLPYTIYFPIF